MGSWLNVIGSRLLSSYLLFGCVCEIGMWTKRTSTPVSKAKATLQGRETIRVGKNGHVQIMQASLKVSS